MHNKLILPNSVTSEAILKEKTPNYNWNNCRPTLYAARWQSAPHQSHQQSAETTS